MGIPWESNPVSTILVYRSRELIPKKTFLKKIRYSQCLVKTRNKTTFNEASFDREYNSIWAGSIDGAFFDMDKFDMHRTLQVATYEANRKDSNKAYYVLGVDVGRFGLKYSSSKIFLIAGISFYPKDNQQPIYGSTTIRSGVGRKLSAVEKEEVRQRQDIV